VADTTTPRARARTLGIAIGSLPTGPNNAITDVPGVLVGQVSVVRDQPHVVRSGVTMVVPREGGIWEDYAYAGSHILNGNGEMTGLGWIEESGMLGSPIGITGTAQVGLVRDQLVAEAYRLGLDDSFELPVVGETWDGWLSAIETFPVDARHVTDALAGAVEGPVPEGNTGGGTGSICHEFKGGTGTASRLVSALEATYTLGVLVQANYGARQDLRVDGVQVGVEIGLDVVPSPWISPPSGGSIIGVIATDAPLLPDQCRRLARRATIGLGRVGGYGHDSSGDIFLAFATGNHLPARPGVLRSVASLPNETMDPSLPRRRRRHRRGDPECALHGRNQHRPQRESRSRTAPRSASGDFGTAWKVAGHQSELTMTGRLPDRPLLPPSGPNGTPRGCR
jgi:D-aminopeptidase